MPNTGVSQCRRQLQVALCHDMSILTAKRLQSSIIQMTLTDSLNYVKNKTKYHMDAVLILVTTAVSKYLTRARLARKWSSLLHVFELVEAEAKLFGRGVWGDFSKLAACCRGHGRPTAHCSYITHVQSSALSFSDGDRLENFDRIGTENPAS